jgi:hypothetical protein
MRRRLNYANVTATIALFFAMSGGALAAKHYLINSTKQINPKVLKALKGNVGARGAAGATGAPGAPGGTGKEGPRGQEGKEGKEGKTPEIPALVWHPLGLENGWAVFAAGGGGVPSYAKDAEGFVHLSGALNGGPKTSTQFATLPPGYRPTRGEFVWLRAPATNGSSDPHLVDIEIENTGAMSSEESGTGANLTFVSLEGMSFYAG